MNKKCKNTFTLDVNGKKLKIYSSYYPYNIIIFENIATNNNAQKRRIIW
jgi:hypothetical protein